MNLTSLMDVFTILVFFLLVNSASTEVLETPKQITLPASVVEEKPRETVVIFVSPTEVTVQGESVVRTRPRTILSASRRPEHGGDRRPALETIRRDASSASVPRAVARAAR